MNRHRDASGEELLLVPSYLTNRSNVSKSRTSANFPLLNTFFGRKKHAVSLSNISKVGAYGRVGR